MTAPAVAFGAGVSPIEASATDKKLATDHFVIGKRALDSHNWEKAIAELRASIDVVDSPNARLELGRALRDSGNLSEAWSEFNAAALLATRLAPSEQRYAKTADAATDEREDVATKLAFVNVTVAHAPAGATLKVGDHILVPEDWATPVVVSAGAVDVVVTNSAGAEITRRTVNAAIGETTAVALDAQPPAEPSSSATADATAEEKAPEPQPAPPPPQNKTTLRTFSYVAAGVGVAGIATFTVFGLMSNATYNDLKSVCPHGCPPDKRGEIDNGMMQQTLANVGFAVGLVGLAVGATTFFLSAPSQAPTPAAAAFVIGPGYLGVRGSL